jgi:acylphosphatase
MRVRVLVSGRVQGVWFRDSCQREARAVGVGGWVRNRMDGSVEAEFEGSETAVARMVSWCRAGPPRADVAAVTVENVDPTGDTRFVVR